MLTDSSLTNILTVSGVSQIRYRAYTQSCERSHLLDSLRWDGSSLRSRDKLSPDPSNSMLIKAHRYLIETGIPSMWRALPIAPGPSSTLVTLELWVFWFDELHTGKIDSNEDLRELEEIKMGSFTWENVFSKNMSPNASPVVSRTRQVLVTVAEEYKLFIKALKSLVRDGMIRRGALPLGHFFVFSFPYQDADALASSDQESSSTPLLCCTYNVYLASTDLIFQPSTRRVRLTPYVAYRAKAKDITQVILSPSGESASIIQERPTVASSLEKHILRQWSALLDIPFSQLSSASLVGLRSDSGEVLLYPAALVYVPFHSKQVPTSMAGMNGVCGHNGGHSENVGEKWWRSTWIANATAQPAAGTSALASIAKESAMNYWAYTSPRLATASTVFDSLAASNTQASSHGILQKALSEPVAASPVMAAKSVTTPSNATRRSLDSHCNGSNIIDTDGGNNAGMTLLEFTLSHFASDPKLDIVQNYTPPDDEDTEMMSVEFELKPPTANGQAMPSTSTYTPPASGSLTSQSQPLHLLQTPHVVHVNDDLRLSSNLNDDMNDGLLDLPTHLDDDMPDFDNFDFNVTEEDFDFFESRPMSDPAPGNNASNAPTLMLMDSHPMEDVPVKSEDLDLSQLLTMSDGLLADAMPIGPLPTKDGSILDPSQVALENDAVTETVLNDLSLESPAIPFKYETQATPIAASPLRQAAEKPSPQASQQPAYQKMEHIVVPPEFAPVSLVADVDDAKYGDGGKFMYTPTVQERQPTAYCPDYAPKAPAALKPRRHAKDPSPTIYTTTDNRRFRTESGTTSLDDGSDNMSLSSTCSDDSSGSDDTNNSSSSGSGSDNSLKKNNTANHDAHLGDHDDHSWQDAHEQAQERFLRVLLGTNKRNRVVKTTATPLDYDCPFASAVAWGPLQTVRLEDDQEETIKALDYLCQQAVMGGYPFAGGLASLSGSGGEITPSESAKALVARQRDLTQNLHGDATHVPALPTDEDRLTLTFKSVLSTIFDTQPGNMDPLDLTPRGSVTIKGPLNVQQYYDLSETNQTHSKYGKYQIKKRRPAEPNLDTLSLPDIVVSRQDELIEGSPKLITFWEKLRLEPFSCKKNVQYFAVFPNNSDLEQATAHFFKSLSSVYETCLLGFHRPGNIGSYHGGLVPVPLLPESQEESWQQRQLRSYMAECQNLGSALGGAMAENVHIVIYLVNPASHVSAHLDLSRCFHKLMFAYHAAAMGLSTKLAETSRARVVMQLVPMEHILRSNAFGGYLKFGLKEIAFSVYNKCPAIVARNPHQTKEDDTRTVTEVYAPAFVLSKTIPESIAYTLQTQLVHYPTTALQSDATLHLGYAMSLDRRWMAIVWTDSWGELVEFAVLRGERATHRVFFEEAWRRTQSIARRTGLPWTFVIAKVGLMFENELQAWTDAIPSEANVALVCLDLESPLSVRLDPGHNGSSPADLSMNSTGAPMATSSASASATDPLLTLRSHTSGNAMNAASAAAATDVSFDETFVLVLNHRVAYSRQRDQVSKGILAMDYGYHSEQWMLPLASGYLIHASKPGSETPNEEPFSGAPLVIETHLVLNQTRQSAYSTLRDTIKQYHALSHVNLMPSSSNCLPLHLVLVERLVRVLLMIHTN